MHCVQVNGIESTQVEDSAATGLSSVAIGTTQATGQNSAIACLGDEVAKLID